MKRPAGSKYLGWLGGLVCSIAVGCGDWTISTGQEDLTLREKRGKQIYAQGTSPSGGEILAYVGESSLEMPGSAMACANCHGLDGQGKPEGGINPSNITLDALTKPYGSTHAFGRQHPAYTERGLELAITRGMDPAWNKLLPVMPRYVMSREDLADLVVYLARLGKERDSGIGESSVVMGSVVPSKGALGEMGQAIKAVSTAFFDDLNSQGGIYGRRIDLKFVETAETPQATRLNVERFITAESVFAMTGAFIAGYEKELIPLLAQKEVPLIGPITLYPQTGFPLNRQVFYLLSGIEGQARTLIDFAAKQPEFKNTQLAVVNPQSDNNLQIVEAIKVQSKRRGFTVPRTTSYVAGGFDAVETTKQLKEANRDAVFFLGNGEEALSFLREADKSAWFPFIFLSSASAGTEFFNAPVGFNGKVFLAFPTSPADQTAAGIKEFRMLAEKYRLPTRHLAVQISAYCAAKVLVEALKRAGKGLSREKLIRALEELYEYRTGLTPAITYGPNRRIGAMGAYVVTIDLKEKQFLPASGWISID